PNLGIENVDISHQMSMLLNKDVYVENDANCAALAEHRFGVAVGTKNSVTITLGTGIGGGIIIDNKIFAGSLFGGGEIGHHVIKARGEKCSCKRHGCWESYASATALRRMAGGKSPKEVFAKARAGDKALKAVVDEYIEYLCEGLVNIANILQPEIIVIGGGISGEGSYFLDKIHNSINGRFFDNQNPTKIVIAGLGNDAGIIGAALLERRR
ncbi:MAG: ROK family protein, partial [Defluviitaleaceae bacterium]|nr:ROK family protein [Defluviitaleaceae bacterium]